MNASIKYNLPKVLPPILALADGKSLRIGYPLPFLDGARSAIARELSKRGVRHLYRLSIDYRAEVITVQHLFFIQPQSGQSEPSIEYLEPPQPTPALESPSSSLNGEGVEQLSKAYQLNISFGDSPSLALARVARAAQLEPSQLATLLGLGLGPDSDPVPERKANPLADLGYFDD